MQTNLKSKIHLEATLNLNERIGKRIRDMRKDKHITQEQLAEALDVSIKHISSVERGLASLSLERLIDASYILDCSLEYLVLGDETADVAARLPRYVIEMFKRNDQAELALFQDYLHMFERLRKN